MRLTRLQQYLLGGAIAGFALLCGGMGYLHFAIQAGVDEYTEQAQASYPDKKDGVEALIEFVQSDQHSLQERNRAVWALGQLRDPRALPVLEAAYTGKPCDHSRFLCQHELAKAIKLCRGGTPNIMRIRLPHSPGNAK